MLILDSNITACPVLCGGMDYITSSNGKQAFNPCVACQPSLLRLF